MTIINLTVFLYSIFGYTPDTKDYVLAGSILLNVILALIIYRKYYYNHTAFARIKIRRFKKDFPEFTVKIVNTGVLPFELDPPIVIFKKRGSKRLFQVRTGNINGFPVSLFRKEEYDFIVDLARFYTTDSSLITYTKVLLEVRDKNQKKLKRKRFRIK
ncbi:MAG TPA: hypothetical protein VHO90_04370 [Bacteroidales bacterium]|nr:hypothetical protein [Bacteroidales bacterium]